LSQAPSIAASRLTIVHQDNHRQSRHHFAYANWTFLNQLGDNPQDIHRAIAQNSPHAKTLSRPGDYARRTLKRAEQSPDVQSTRSQRKENGKNIDQKVRPSRKEAQKKHVNQRSKPHVKKPDKQKKKARKKGMSY